jgi:protein-L-isoaspartate(D-aspartate) O-methyltransferase
MLMVGAAAYCLEELKDHCRPGTTCLDIGCGSGIFAALMSQLAGHRAKVIGIDHIPELVELSRRNASKHLQSVMGEAPWPPMVVSLLCCQCPPVSPSEWAHPGGCLDQGYLEFSVADGRLGLPEHAPYDWLGELLPLPLAVLPPAS